MAPGGFNDTHKMRIITQKEASIKNQVIEAKANELLSCQYTSLGSLRRCLIFHHDADITTPADVGKKMCKYVNKQ